MFVVDFVECASTCVVVVEKQEGSFCGSRSTTLPHEWVEEEEQKDMSVVVVPLGGDGRLFR